MGYYSCCVECAGWAKPEPPVTQEEAGSFAAWGEADGGFPAGLPEVLPERITFKGTPLSDLTGDKLREFRAFVEENCS
jgi:hypothetical protein